MTVARIAAATNIPGPVHVAASGSDRADQTHCVLDQQGY